MKLVRQATKRLDPKQHIRACASCGIRNIHQQDQYVKWNLLEVGNTFDLPVSRFREQRAKSRAVQAATSVFPPLVNAPNTPTTAPAATCDRPCVTDADRTKLMGRVVNYIELVVHERDQDTHVELKLSLRRSRSLAISSTLLPVLFCWCFIKFICIVEVAVVCHLF